MTEAETAVRHRWHTLLGNMLADFRRRCPEDPRSDRELLVSLMDHFCEKGLVSKNEDGKYVLLDVVGSLDIARASGCPWPTGG